MSQIYMEQQKRRQQTQPASLSSAVGQSLEHSAETLPPELLANVDAVQNVKPHTGRELHLGLLYRGLLHRGRAGGTERVQRRI